jgi:siroheme synthase-like protein
MRTHPIFLRLEGRPCVVVGGDGAAEAKVRCCLDADASVTVVAAELTSGLAALVGEGRVRHVARDYRRGDLSGFVLAYASTRDESRIAELRAEAECERVLLNVIDTPESCSFIAPAIVARGELTIAVGTGGASPGLAARLRRELEERFGPEYGPFVAILGGVRRALAGEPGRTEVLARLIDSPLLELVRRGRLAEIDGLLGRVAGEGVTLARLGVTVEAQA